MNKPRVLIVDDDPNLRKTLSDILKAKGYETFVAADGGEGLAFLKENVVHLVLVDLGLPDMSGLDVLNRVKADYPSMEAIVLTGQATLDSAIEATNRGAFSYLVKPYEIDQLMLHIKRAVEKQQAEEKIIRHNIELSQLNAELKVLFDVSQAISRTLDKSELVSELLQALVKTEIFPFEIKGAIFLDEGEGMRLVSFLNMSEAEAGPCNAIQAGACLCGRAMATGEIVVSLDSGVDEQHKPCAHDGKPHGHIIVPLKVVKKIVGLLVLYTQSGTEVNESQIKLFSTIGDMIGIAINNAKLYEEIKSSSLRDPLTGLFNRRFMEEQMEKHFNSAQRYDEMLSVIMVDIDHFKIYNDTHGHQEGDRLLAKIAVIFLKGSRSADDVFRYGGEEFLLVLPKTDLAKAHEAAERLRAVVEAEAGVTISLGVAAYQETVPDKEALIRMADAALYRAKKGGRNRVEINKGDEPVESIIEREGN